MLTLIISVSIAQIPARPSPAKLYNNLSKAFPDFLSQQNALKLEQKLENFSAQTSNQICVVVVDDFDGEDQSSFATGILNSWGIGQKKTNNGLVILVKPTGGKGERKLFIAVGYGLEGAITDLQTKHIREDDIQPLFKKGLFFEGLDAGINSLMLAAKGEYNVKATKKQENSIIPIIIIIVIFLILFAGQGGGRSSGGITYFGGGSSFGGFSGGGGSSFGGFGGGGGGGGGSGGSW